MNAVTILTNALTQARADICFLSNVHEDKDLIPKLNKIDEALRLSKEAAAKEETK